MIRRMCRFKKTDSEDMEAFMRRTNKVISEVMDRQGILSWDILVRREVFKWAGWVARLNVFDPSRITLHVLLHKNWDWLRVIADQFNGRQLHGRRLKVWRWEALVYKFFDENFPGTSWIQAAQDKSEWEDLVQTIQ